MTVQGLDWQRKKWSWFARCVLRAGEWSAARFPNNTVAVSRELQAHLDTRHGTEAVYIPNGTHLRTRRSGPHLARLGLAPDLYVLFLGRLSPEKNCHLAIEAFQAIRADMKLVFAGGSSHSDEYISRLRQHADERVVFLDWLSGDALEEVLTNAAVFVLPSDIEGMSLALLDAMAAGVCVLASDIPENAEAIGDAGFLFRRGDVDDLRRMLNLLIANAGLRAFAGQEGKARVRENYLWDDVAIQIERVYLDLVGQTVAERMASRSATAA